MVEMVWKSQLEFEPRDSDKIWEWVVAIAAMAWNCWVPVDYEIWKNWIWYDVTLFVDRKHQETTWNWDVWSPFSEAKMGVIFYLLPRSVISLLDCRTWRVSVHLGMSIWAMNKKGPPGSSVYFFLGGWITTQLLVGIISSIMACSGSLLYKQPGLFMVQVYRPFFFQPGSICFNTLLLGVRTHELTKCCDFPELRCLPPGHLCCLARFFFFIKTQT